MFKMIDTTKAVISIHALREEGDSDPAVDSESGARFLSTPSARRATLEDLIQQLDVPEISIHALREEGDSRPSP